MIDLGLDNYAHLQSPIHSWDTRFKLVGLMALIFAFSFVQDLRLLPVILVITLAIFLISRLPFDFLFTRLKYPGVFLLAIAIVLPIFSGSTVLFSIGPIDIHQEGLLELLVIVVRFVCILTLGIVLFGSAPFLTSIKAMRALRLSPILADIMLLTYRYIFEIGYELKTMETAMRLRHFQGSRFSPRGISTLASLSGTLLIRSYERSERVYKAMVMRGYGHEAFGGVSGQAIFKSKNQDVIALIIVLILAAAIVAAEIALRQI